MKKIEKLNLTKLNKNISKNIKIGELSQDIIDLLGLNLKPQNINIWSSRIDEHCSKHKHEYSSPTSYNKAISSIPLIIQEPDFIGLHHKNGNIQFVKKIDDISLVGIKIVKGNNNLLFRTIFPISENKLENSIKSKKLIPYPKK